MGIDMTSMAPDFDEAFRAKFAELLLWRRDVRHFETRPLPEGCIERLLRLACLAPSVGLSEPWRYVLVDAPDKRKAVRENFLAANAEAFAQYDGDRAKIYAQLKLAGLDDAPVQLAVFADPDPEQGAGLGRRTMPETVCYSAVAAIYTLWLAARAEGVGMGWVSILDPEPLNAGLDVPAHWRFIGYFCIGYPAQMRDTPELEQMHWEKRADPASLIVRR
jgi:5,6-dimethylbenzimidazole synthase